MISDIISIIISLSIIIRLVFTLHDSLLLCSYLGFLFLYSHCLKPFSQRLVKFDGFNIVKFTLEY